MKVASFENKKLKKFLRDKKTATLSELKAVLGTQVRMTVFRKLKELAYVSSYSHGGRYYTLREIAKFNEAGLWQFKAIKFSEQGSLIQTARVWISRSARGYSCLELEQILGVSMGRVLLTLRKEKRISRQKMGGRYIYYAIDPKKRRGQMLLRAEQSPVLPLRHVEEKEEEISDEMKASMILFFTSLDEKHRRWYAGLESLKRGHGGDRQLSELLQMDVGTVSRGRQELLDPYFNEAGIRKSGGGRQAVKKKVQKLSNTSKR